MPSTQGLRRPKLNFREFDRVVLSPEGRRAVLAGTEHRYLDELFIVGADNSNGMVDVQPTMHPELAFRVPRLYASLNYLCHAVPEQP